MPQLDYISVETDKVEAIARIRCMPCASMILSHHLIGTSPAAIPYLRDCAVRHAELEEIGNQVEIGLCTCAWLNS